MIPHLQQQIEFLTACRDHGAENVEWRVRTSIGIAPDGWTSYVRANEEVPTWSIEHVYEFRVRPRKHFIPRAEVPMPLKVRPKEGDVYWYIALNEETQQNQWRWSGNISDEMTFKRGLCFATREDAEANLRAMLAREEE